MKWITKIEFIFLFNFFSVKALELSDIIILIISQEAKYNLELAANLETNILEQVKPNEKNFPIVYLSHKHFPHVGDWTVLPILPAIFFIHENTDWLIVCTERTRINLYNLVKVLNEYNKNETIWFGQGLYDRDPVIIHHFSYVFPNKKFLYPNFDSGFAISLPLLKNVSMKFVEKYSDNELEANFAIDPAHELAVNFWAEGTGFPFHHQPLFCINEDDHSECASFVKGFVPCNDLVPDKSIYFAVKTYEEFHKNRIPIVKKTWAKYIQNVLYFSDVFDKNIPTIKIKVPNTDYGHCAKTMEILSYFYEEINKNLRIKWIVLVDDDTIISPSRLRKLLSCYEHSTNLVLGERYGFKVTNLDQIGYNYITGGGGTVFSSDVIKKIVEHSKYCSCPHINSPDDMVLGICLDRINISVIHSPYFHQARINDYPPEFLSKKDEISFHKHWNIDPVLVYEDLFKEDDRLCSNTHKINEKTEL